MKRRKGYLSLFSSVTIVSAVAALGGCAAGAMNGDAEPRGREFGPTMPTETARLLLGGYPGGEVDIFAGLPPGFPEVDLPPGYELLGATVRGPQQQVVLRGATPPEQASDDFAAAFAASGWLRMPRPGPGPLAQGGFVDSSPSIPLPRPQQVCHDDSGDLNILVADLDGTAVVTLSRAEFSQFSPAGAFGSAPDISGRRDSCEEKLRNLQRSQGVRGRGAFMALRQHMPRLELPVDGADARRAGSGGSFSGSTGEVEAKAQLSLDWSIERVYAHFAQQIESQGWTVDATWSGDLSAGGTWTRAPEPDLELLGNLTVLRMAADFYALSFRLISPGSGTTGPVAVEVLGPPLNAPELGIRGIPPGYIDAVPRLRD